MKQIRKKISLALLMILLTLPSFSQFINLDFEELNLPPDSFWNGSDNSGGFSSYDVFLYNTYIDWGGGMTSWEGFAYSNKINDTTQAFGNMYSSYAGENSNGIHALTYMNSDLVNYIVIPNYIIFNTPTLPISIEISNSTYTALTMLNGDFVSKKFGGVTGNDPDWLKLSVFGFQSGSGIPTDTIEFYLADYRFANNSEDYIIKDWTTMDLSLIGTVDSLGFILSSSDTGSYGMNTPAIFCFDNLYVQFFSGVETVEKSSLLIYPNPATNFVIIQGYTGEVSVYSTDGALVLSDVIQEKLNLDMLAKGIYIVKAGDRRSLISKM